MNDVLILLFFLLGLIFGSFFNVVGLRMPQKQPFANERSMCPDCGHLLAWYELIPLLSYAVQRGKCNQCQRHISILYPVIELSAALLFALSYIKTGLSWELPVALLTVTLLLIVFVSDIRYMLIPNRLLGFFLPFLVITRVIQPLDPWWSSAVGALMGVIIIALIILISRGGMGGGDMKLFALLGIVLGFQKTLLALLLSSVIGALIGGVLLGLKRINRKQPIPFGPFIVMGSLISYFQGDFLLAWYLHNLI
ncbi:A24 family peptidase [Barrientosiimonas marina]|uniref:Prepilin peptidase n=1 Tax=Lentibacillus kimchii TaxID=1542911 RepID=A0ABW2UY58_9BACI